MRSQPSGADRETTGATLPAKRRGYVVWNTLIYSLGGVANGILNAAILALSARHGQLGEIAAYTVAGSALSFVAIIAGGGAGLLYVTGDERQRRAVQSQWVLYVLPALSLGSVVVGFFYARMDYPWAALAATGAVVVGNSLGTLQLGDLTRQLRFTAAAATICLPKVLGLVLVMLGMNLTLVLATASVMQFLMAEFFLGKDSWFRPAGLAGLSLREANRAFSFNKKLFSFTLADLYNSRSAGILLSFFADVRVMATFGSVMVIYQALGSVLDTALRAPMASRVKARKAAGENADPGRSAEILVLVGALVAAVVIARLSSFITERLLGLEDSSAAVWLALIAASLPFFALKRVYIFERIAMGEYESASRISWLTAGVLTVAIPALVLPLSAFGAACVPVVGEALTGTLLIMMLVKRRW